MTSTQQQQQRQTQRQIVLAKYRTSNIFQPTSSTTYKPSGKENQSNNCISRNNKHSSKQFEPKYENITAKERYLKHFHTNTTPLTKKTFTVIKPKQQPTTKSTTQGVTSKKPSPPLQAHDIMCRDMFNGCDTTTYRLRRCKSTFIERSYTTQPSSLNKQDINARTRCIEYNRSNIFFVDNKPLKTEPSSKPTSSTTSKPLHHKPQKSFTFKRSLYATNTDWKACNTEVPSFKRSKSLHSNAFKPTSLYKETHSSNLKEKTKAIPSNSKTHFNNIESVSYNIISGEEDAKCGKGMLNEKKGYVSESYVIDVPQNFDETDVNTIKNYFIKEKIHIYGIDESVNHIGNNKGKIKFKVRRNVDDKTFQEKLNAINQLIDDKKMKMKIEDTNKVKQRQKTPGVRYSWGGEGKQHGKKNANNSKKGVKK